MSQEETPRVLYRLPRRCDPCHDGDHQGCERVVYASPSEPRVPCECECRGDVRGDPECRCRRTPIHTHVNPNLVTCDDPIHPQYRRLKAAAGHAGGLSTLATHTRAHFARISPLAHAARWGHGHGHEGEDGAA